MQHQETIERFNYLKHLIGNTPLIAVHFKFRGKERIIYAKAENFNMTGSVKDRMAFYILQKAYQSGNLKKGDTIVEATSGNTGIAFAAIGKALGHPVTIFMPDWMSRERVELIKSLGADIIPVSHEKGGFIGSIRMTEEFAKQTPNVFLPRQFDNIANVEAHEQTTGQEIWWQLQTISQVPDAFVAGVGTGGTIMGVGNFLRTINNSIRIFPLEPAESPTLTTGYKVGKHRIQGISDEFIPSIVKLDQLDEVINVQDGDAIIMAQKLASKLGIAVGISSGANFIGAVMVQDKIGVDAIVVTIFPDDNKKYLSTDLLRKETIKDSYLSTDIDLCYFKSYKRVCRLCCDLYECTQNINN